MGKRRRAREIVMQYLYQNDLNSQKEGLAVEEFLQNKRLDDDAADFAKDLINKTVDSGKEIDEVLKKYVDNWDITRIAAVDRNILRMSACEMLYFADIPPIVSINEAVDIAKKYSTAESGKFVNGVLDKIKHEIIDKNA